MRHPLYSSQDPVHLPLGCPFFAPIVCASLWVCSGVSGIHPCASVRVPLRCVEVRPLQGVVEMGASRRCGDSRAGSIADVELCGEAALGRLGRILMAL